MCQILFQVLRTQQWINANPIFAELTFQCNLRNWINTHSRMALWQYFFLYLLQRSLLHLKVRLFLSDYVASFCAQWYDGSITVPSETILQKIHPKDCWMAGFQENMTRLHSAQDAEQEGLRVELFTSIQVPFLLEDKLVCEWKRTCRCDLFKFFNKFC